MMGRKLIDDDTEEGMATWYVIHEMVNEGSLHEIDHETDYGTVCEYRFEEVEA